MTDARDVLRSGDPRAALEQLKQEVRKAPRDARLRTFLFQMFCVFGEWERAVTQLTVAAELGMPSSSKGREPNPPGRKPSSSTVTFSPATCCPSLPVRKLAFL